MDVTGLASPPSEAEARAALLRREQQVDAIQGSLGWRLLSYYGPYKRRFVQPLWRRLRGLVERWLRLSSEDSRSPYERWSRFSDRFRHTLGAEERWPGTEAVSVSIVLTVDTTSLCHLAAAIASVRAQSSVRWELCVAVVHTDATLVDAVSRHLADGDPRILLDAHPYPTHAAATNAAWALARGSIVAMMSAAIVLAVDALDAAVGVFRDTAADVLYSDEDLRDAGGRRHAPQLKPGWSPDLLLSWMYWSRLVFYRRSALAGVLPLPVDLTGAHYYELALRVTEQQSRIVHLPRILAHVQSPPTPTGGSATAVEREAGRRALEATLVRRGIAGSVHWHHEGDVYRVRRTIAERAKVSIVVPTRDGLAMLRRCLRAVEMTDHPNFEVLIVDNGSTQEATLAFLAATRHTVLRAPGPFNFSRLNNLAVTHTDGRYLIFLNNDAEPCRPDWLGALEEHAQRPEVGAVGAKLLYANGRIQHAGIAVGIGGLAGHPYRFRRCAPEGIRDVSAVTAACLMMRRDAFDAVGGFDERLPVNSNDVDLCLRLREHGYLVVYTPHAVLYHYESQTRGMWATPDDAWLMTRRWRDVLRADPYYNPNLDLLEEGADMDLSKPDGMVCLYGGVGHDDGSLNLVPGRSVGQAFFATGPNLSAVVVRGVVEGERAGGALRLRLRQSPVSSVDVRAVERPIVGRTSDELWFCFDPIADSADRYWYFFLEAVDGSAITLRRSAIVSDVMGPCFEDHAPSHGALRFQLYARASYRCGASPP
jgi:GT2 family glycosyltransferase